MQGLTYFQSRPNNNKRKPAALLDTPDFNKQLNRGIQPESLRSINPKNEARINNLHAKVDAKFYGWRIKLRLGFSLLFFGYGSKKAILNSFGQKACQDGGVLSVYGWAHTLTLRSLLLKVMFMLRAAGTETNKANGDARSLLASIQQSVGEQRLYVIIHGIDAPALRSRETQCILGELAATAGIHLVASIDHVNAPLLWEKRTASHFSWVFEELTTFVPYAQETMGIQALLYSARLRKSYQETALSLKAGKGACCCLLQDGLKADVDSRADELRTIPPACQKSLSLRYQLLTPVALINRAVHQGMKGRGKELQWFSKLLCPMHDISSRYWQRPNSEMIARVRELMCSQARIPELGTASPASAVSHMKGGIPIVLKQCMTLHDLFKASRDRFLVTNELALRSHLNEFRDHRLVQSRSISCRRTTDGAEILYIPFEDQELEQLVLELG